MLEEFMKNKKNNLSVKMYIQALRRDYLSQLRSQCSAINYSCGIKYSLLYCACCIVQRHYLCTSICLQLNFNVFYKLFISEHLSIRYIRIQTIQLHYKLNLSWIILLSKNNVLNFKNNCIFLCPNYVFWTVSFIKQ